MRKILLLAFTLLAFLPLKAQNLDTPKLDSLFTVINEHHKGMGSVSIFQNGKEIYQRSYGYCDVENQIANSASTKFRIGSITKTFTATIIMKLIEQGKLTLTSRLSEYYPQVPNSDKITIEHLLQHRSGIVNFTNVKDYFEWNDEKQTKEQLIDRITSGGISFEPDEKFQYSNSNYVLLTCIAEDVSSKSFPELLDQIIITPCNLSNTYVGGKIDSNKEEAYSYTRVSSDWQKSNETDMSVPLGAGFIVSTSYDLNKFFDCLFNEKVVNKESLNRMMSVKDRFGFGLLLAPFYENICYGHSGGIDGFQSGAFYFPEAKLSIALVENGVAYKLNDILLGCFSIYFGKEYKLPTFTNAVEITAEELDKYLGVYSAPELPITFAITKRDNSLIIQGTGQPTLPLEYVGSNVFKNETVGLVLEFIPQAGKMILKQVGQTIELTKSK